MQHTSTIRTDAENV